MPAAAAAFAAEVVVALLFLVLISLFAAVPVLLWSWRYACVGLCKCDGHPAVKLPVFVTLASCFCSPMPLPPKALQALDSHSEHTDDDDACMADDLQRYFGDYERQLSDAGGLCVRKGMTSEIGKCWGRMCEDVGVVHDCVVSGLLGGVFGVGFLSKLAHPMFLPHEIWDVINVPSPKDHRCLIKGLAPRQEGVLITALEHSPLILLACNFRTSWARRSDGSGFLGFHG